MHALTRLTTAFALLFCAATLLPQHAGAELRKPEYYSDFEGKAIKGYDTVAYFTDGTATRGLAAYTHVWKDTTWYFASAEHRDLFAADPEAYAPQFGGYCAWGILKDRLVHVDPEAWEIVDGKLYLNLNQKIHDEWAEKMENNIINARRKWPDILVLSN